MGSAVHLLVLSTTACGSNIELVKIAAVRQSGVKGHFTERGQLLGDYSLDLASVWTTGPRLRRALRAAQAEAGKRGQNRHRAEHHHSARQGQKGVLILMSINAPFISNK